MDPFWDREVKIEGLLYSMNDCDKTCFEGKGKLMRTAMSHLNQARFDNSSNTWDEWLRTGDRSHMMTIYEISGFDCIHSSHTGKWPWNQSVVRQFMFDILNDCEGFDIALRIEEFHQGRCDGKLVYMRPYMFNQLDMHLKKMRVNYRFRTRKEICQNMIPSLHRYYVGKYGDIEYEDYERMILGLFM